MIKKRLLFTTEFTKLNTGYSQLYRNLLTELNKNPELIIGEQACYCHPQQHAQLIAETPWKVFSVLPTTPEEEQYYNNNPTAEFGSAKLEQTCLEFFPHVICCLPDTLIFTSDGIKTIEEIKIEDKVLTKSGKYEEVIQTFKNDYNGLIYTIKTTKK